jgi:hypothetical protein
MSGACRMQENMINYCIFVGIPEKIYYLTSVGKNLKDNIKINFKIRNIYVCGFGRDLPK